MVEHSEEGQRGRQHDGFQVHLDVFEGPFDLLLNLIAKHKLDVTEVALSHVTDEFLAYMGAYQARREHEEDLEQATHFLVVAATLLDLKAARLLPSGDVEDDADLELLEARDLLFARLLQYRAYKEVAGVLAERVAEQSRRHGRTAGPDPGFAAARPEVRLGVGPERFAALAARVLAPEPEPVVPTSHLYVPPVDVGEQANILVGKLRGADRVPFSQLVTGCTSTPEVVARFLALLELYRDGAVGFDQAEPLAELYVRWTGTREADIRIGDEYRTESR